MIPLHLGELHPYEQWIAIALAFGPFLLLFVVVAVRRRQAIAEEEVESEAEVDPPDAPDVDPPDVIRERTHPPTNA